MRQRIYFYGDQKSGRDRLFVADNVRFSVQTAIFLNIEHSLIGFYHADCLLRGTNRAYK